MTNINQPKFEKARKVFDNVFSEELAKKTWESLQRPKWSYTGGSATGGRFWHMEKLDQENVSHP